MRSGADGFTLLELMLVLLVMSLVMAVAYPSMSRGRTAFHLRSVGRDVVNALRFARDTAVTEQKVMIASVDFEAQTITVSDDVGGGARSFAPPSDVRIQALTASGGGSQQGPLRIRFLPNGSSDDARILLKSDTGASLKIVADPILGVARVVSEQGEKGP
jgi:general secretion pathway protein H